MIVSERDYDRCVRCGGRGGEWHHRRRRRVQDAHTHCACNGITLCRRCHAWCHDHPTQAKNIGGWIVSAWAQPLDTPLLHHTYSWLRLECDGTFTLMHECAGCEEIKVCEAGLCLTCLKTRVDSGAIGAEALDRLLERERIS